MKGLVVHLSKDLIDPLEKLCLERCDKNIATTARALLRQILANRGLYDLEVRARDVRDAINLDIRGILIWT